MYACNERKRDPGILETCCFSISDAVSDPAAAFNL
jgi:hypothetical protein